MNHERLSTSRPIQFSKARTLAYACILVAAVLGLLEGVLRLAAIEAPLRPRILLRSIDAVTAFPYMQPDRELFWSPHPGFHATFHDKRVNINGLGLRGPRVALPKPPGRRRVACFGDSITFGYDVHDDETYPARLQQALAGRSVDVLNAGVNGYTSHQVLARFRQVVPAVQADVATFCVGWNDRVERPVDDRTYAQRVRAAMAVEGVLNRLSLYRAMARVYVALVAPAPPSNENDVPRVSPAQYQENLTTLVRECRARGVAPVFIALPHRRRPEGETERDRKCPYPPLFLALARREGVAIVEVPELEIEAPLPGNAHYFLDSLHLSVEGNLLLARELARVLSAQGLV